MKKTRIVRSMQYRDKPEIYDDEKIVFANMFQGNEKISPYVEYVVEREVPNPEIVELEKKNKILEKKLEDYGKCISDLRSENTNLLRKTTWYDDFTKQLDTAKEIFKKINEEIGLSQEIKNMIFNVFGEVI